MAEKHQKKHNRQQEDNHDEFTSVKHSVKRKRTERKLRKTETYIQVAYRYFCCLHPDLFRCWTHEHYWNGSDMVIRFSVPFIPRLHFCSCLKCSYATY